MIDFPVDSSKGDFPVVLEEGAESEEKVLACVNTVCPVILDRTGNDVGICVTGEGSRVDAHMCEFSQGRCCTSCSRVMVVSGWKKKNRISESDSCEMPRKKTNSDSSKDAFSRLAWSRVRWMSVSHCLSTTCS